MPMDDILLECEEKMDSALKYLRDELRGVRTGRASAGLVEHIKVQYYGSPTDLRKLANLAVPEPDLIVIKPFDPASMTDIQKAIQSSNIGLTPMADGKLIRLKVPSLSTERREQLAGQVRKMGEASKVAIRNARRDANKDVDKEEKDGLIPEDQAEKGKADIQKLTDDYEKQVADLVDGKTKEIMET
jgi:ribosome recycling factor